jgi:hypothetical protein
MSSRFFKDDAILAWSVDDFEQLNESVRNSGIDLARFVENYNIDSFNKNILPLFKDAPIKLNLGGETEKSKLITTDKPTGIFDFSLASLGMYKVPEYYSEKLKLERPDIFKEFELPSGVVPSNLVKKDDFGYFYEDANERYDCVIRQKGETAIEEGIPNSKLKFATRNRKVYLTYKRNKGKVKYVEIYSLFYYTSLEGNLEYAIRHIPALMVAEYLESIGVKVRFYMTRFVTPEGTKTKTKFFLKKENDGYHLPMWDVNQNNRVTTLFIQPIIVKEFGQEFDKSLGFALTQNNDKTLYNAIAQSAQLKEATTYDIYGQPNREQDEYWEGIERYRNKYKEYVNKGIFKSKEVLPEAMLFFHDMSIKRYLSSFLISAKSCFPNIKGSREEIKSKVLLDLNVNYFFNWWMRLSANNIKNKIDILNSVELRKDLANIEIELLKFLDEIREIWQNIDPTIQDIYGETLVEIIKRYSLLILKEFNIIKSATDINSGFTFYDYITNISDEIKTYAKEGYYPTDQETIDRRNALFVQVDLEMNNFDKIKTQY